MKNFKILVIAHSLKQNKIARFGDVVSESQLTSPAYELIEAGFIEEVLEIVEESELIPLIPVKEEEEEEEEVINVEKEIKDIEKPIISKDDIKDIKKVTEKK